MNTLDLTRTTAEDNQLVELVEEITARLQAGEPCDVDEYAARYPEYADRLRDWMTVMSAMADLGHSLLSHKQKMDSVGSPPLHGEGSGKGYRSGATAGLSSSAEFGSAHPTSSIEHPASSSGLLGDFRILSEVGRGGMGVVYEAEQISLGRRVALKVLPFAAMLDRQQLARFKNEARAAATLDHPNIVAIYSVGAERGVHYYAMQLIEGQSLAQVVDQLRRDRLPLSPGEGRGEGALEFAIPNPKSEIVTQPKVCSPPRHGEGFIPASSPQPPVPSLQSDTEPVARLTTLPNFNSREYFRTIAQLGIQAAEALDHAHQNGILHRDIKPANLLVDDAGKLWITDFGLARIEQDAGMTMTGDILGTLRYMSPEQALAKRVVVDHRSDIYSLGVTLYELLALQPAYSATDRQELLRQIAFEEPRPPREINTHIPQDLETILLKSIEKNPTDRYATAKDMGDDLRRFMTSEPIKARRITSLHRLHKWSRRHRAQIYVTGAFVMFALLLGAGVSGWQALRATRAEQRANEALVKAEERLDFARKAVDDMYTEVAVNLLSREGKLTPLQRSFLQRALAFYEQLANEPNLDVEGRVAAARARVRVGEIDNGLGDPDRAAVAYRRAIEEFEAILSRYPSNDAARHWLALTLDRLGQIHWLHNQFDKAEPLLTRAVEIQKALYRANPSDKVRQNEYAVSLRNLANVAMDRGDYAKAETGYLLCRDLAAELHRKWPDEERFTETLAYAEQSLSDVLLFTGRLAEAEKASHRALETSEKLLVRDPKNPQFRATAGFIAKSAAKTLYGDEKQRALRRSIQLLEELVAEFPDQPEHRETLLTAQTALSGCLEDVNKTQESDDLLQSAIANAEKLVADFPDMPDYQFSLAAALMSLEGRLEFADKVEEAAEVRTRAGEILERLVTKYPDNADYRSVLDVHRFGASALIEAGDNYEFSGVLRSANEGVAKELEAINRHDVETKVRDNNSE